MNKKLLGLTVLGTVAAAFTASLRYTNMKKDIRTGKVDGWIQDVLGDIPYEIKSTIPTPALIADDKSMIYFRLSDADLTKISLAPQSLKDTVQAMAAHEKGHYVDEGLELIQKRIQTAINFNDYETYKRLVIEREKIAWRKGHQFAINKAFFDKYNKANIQMYTLQLAAEKPHWK